MKRSHVRRLLAGVVRGCIVAAVLAVVAPAVLGWKTMTVMSGSMSPTIRTGDAVVAKPVAAADLRPGDVATFKDPEGTARLITHRVLAVAVTDGRVHVTTRGDANNTTESWEAATTGRVGRVVYRIPHIGFVLVPAASPFGRLLLVGLPVLLLGLLVLIRVWRRPAPAPA